MCEKTGHKSNSCSAVIIFILMYKSTALLFCQLPVIYELVFCLIVSFSKPDVDIQIQRQIAPSPLRASIPLSVHPSSRVCVCVGGGITFGERQAQHQRNLTSRRSKPSQRRKQARLFLHTDVLSSNGAVSSTLNCFLRQTRCCGEACVSWQVLPV